MKEPYNAIFQHSLLTGAEPNDNVYLYEWLKKDGDFVNKNEKICTLMVEKFKAGCYFQSTEAGILEIKKLKDDIINSDDIIYSIHFDDSYTKKLEAIEEQRKIEEEINIVKSLWNRPIIDIEFVF